MLLNEILRKFTKIISCLKKVITYMNFSVKIFFLFLFQKLTILFLYYVKLIPKILEKIH
jgi:hypothetical protein